MFAPTDDYLTDNSLSNLFIVKVIVNHLNSLHAHFRKYFPTDIDSGKESWIREPFVSKLSDVTHLSLKAQKSFRFIKRQKFRTSIFKTDVVWFLDKDKKWIPNPFWASLWQTLALLHNMFMWRDILKTDKHQVENPILFGNCWRCSSPCFVLYYSSNETLEQETLSASIPLNVVDNYLNRSFLSIFYWHYYFCIDTKKISSK